MAPPSSSTEEMPLPRLRTTIKGDPGAFWDIAFYPYLVSENDPSIFVTVSSYAIYICEATTEEDSGVRFLTTYKRDKTHQRDIDSINSCVWCYLDEDEPLVAFAGESGQVQVISALKGKLVATLVGHGSGTINDIATHPKYPWIIASASMDSSVRIWDLRRTNDKSMSPCIIVCGHGTAHREGLLTVNWHHKGRYLVTGGFDHKVCVWTIPDLSDESSFWNEISKEQRKRSSDEIRIIHYPHFISSAVHGDYVDRAMFLGDFVLSKAVANANVDDVKVRKEKEAIVLWTITGFNSDEEPPSMATAPKAEEHLETRNGFMRKPITDVYANTYNNIDERYKDMPPFERHLQFHLPYSEFFYIRFGLLRPSPLFPDLHPVLTSGNAVAEIRHWDIDRFITGRDGGASLSSASVADRRTSNLKTKKSLAHKITKPKSRATTLSESANANLTAQSEPSSRASSAALTLSESHGREVSTEATSLASDTLGQAGPATTEDTGSGVPDRTRYPLNRPDLQLREHKINRVNDLTVGQKYMISRAVDWSLCGRWCVVVGEANGIGVMVVLDRPS